VTIKILRQRTIGLVASCCLPFYFPFGDGAHQCIGNHFALMEAQLILALIAQRFLPSLANEDAPELDPTFTLRPKSGLPMKLRNSRR